MYKVNKSVALKQQNNLASQAYSSSPKNQLFDKQVLAEANSLSAPTPSENVYNLAKVVSSQKNYQKELWPSLTDPSAQPSLFKSLKLAWDNRKN